MTPILLAYGALAFPYMVAIGMVTIGRLALTLNAWTQSGMKPPP